MRIKAFTILEVIINLAIMAIIVSMVYFVFGYFSNTVYDYNKMALENFTIKSFYTLMEEDFYTSEKVISENGKVFDIVFYDERKVQYIRKGDYFFRKMATVKDSIKVKDMQIEYLWNDSKKLSENPIKSIRITTLLYEKETLLFVYKNYLSNYLINEE